MFLLLTAMPAGGARHPNTQAVCKQARRGNVQASQASTQAFKQTIKQARERASTEAKQVQKSNKFAQSHSNRVDTI